MGYERRKGLTYSLLLHFVLLVLAIVGLPSFLRKTPPPQPMVLSVDLLPISQMTNAKASELPLAKEEKPVPQEEAKKPTPPLKEESKPEEKKPEPKPEPKPEEKPEPLPDVKKKEPPKKEEAKKEEKPKEEKKKAKEEDLEAVLKKLRDDANKKVEQQEKKEKKSTEEAGTKVKADNAKYDASLPMSMSELDAIRSQISKCWSAPAGAKNAHELQVTLRVQLAEDGTVIQVSIAAESLSRYNSGDTFFRAAADSAMRAVRQCSPLKNLPPEKFQTWRDIEMTFDPKEMLF